MYSKPIFGSYGLRVSSSGFIVDSDYQTVAKFPEERHRTLSVMTDQGLDYFTVDELFHLAMWEYDISNERHLVDFLPATTNGVKTIVRTICDKIPVFRNPVVWKGKYRVIPTHRNYAISSDGKELFHIPTGKSCKQIMHGGYFNASCWNPIRFLTRHTGVHRMVAAAWCSNDNWVDKYIINHKDGIKHNNHYSNLEWCTYQENNVHATYTDLRPDNSPCRIRHYKTGEIREFPSVAECCKYLGIEILQSILNGTIREGKLIANDWEVRRDGDNRPWYYIDTDEKVKLGRYIVTITHPDVSEEIFRNWQDLIIRFKLWNQCTSVPKMCELVELQNPGVKATWIDQHPLKRVQAYRVSDGKVFDADGIKPIARLLGLEWSGIRKILAAGANRILHGYLFRYETDSPWDVNNTQEYKVKGVKAVHLTSNEEIIFSSIREASRHFEVSKSVITKRLGNPEALLNGYSFSHI